MTVEDDFPVDGPHTPHTVVAAARSLTHLVRYLNHATRQRDVFPTPAVLAWTVGHVHEAAAMLPQLCDQLAAAAGRLADQPGVYDQRGGDPAVTAADARTHLRAAWDRAHRLPAPLAAAHEALTRLGIETPKENL